MYIYIYKINIYIYTHMWDTNRYIYIYTLIYIHIESVRVVLSRRLDVTNKFRDPHQQMLENQTGDCTIPNIYSGKSHGKS